MNQCSPGTSGATGDGQRPSRQPGPGGGLHPGAAPRQSGALDPSRLLEGVSAAAVAPGHRARSGPAPGPGYPADPTDPAYLDPQARSPRSAARQMNGELRLAAGRIFANWVVRVTNLPHFRARPDLRLTDVKPGMPELVIAAIDALAAHDPVLQPEPTAAATAAAVSLSRARAAHAFSLGDVLAEIQELRTEFLAAVWRIVDAAPGAAADLAVGSAAGPAAATFPGVVDVRSVAPSHAAPSRPALEPATALAPTPPRPETPPRDLMERFVGLGGDLLIAVSEDWVARLESQARRATPGLAQATAPTTATATAPATDGRG